MAIHPTIHVSVRKISIYLVRVEAIMASSFALLLLLLPSSLASAVDSMFFVMDNLDTLLPGGTAGADNRGCFFLLADYGNHTGGQNGRTLRSVQLFSAVSPDRWQFTQPRRVASIEVVA